MYLETAPILSVVEIKKKLGNSIPLSATTLSHRVSNFFFFSRFVIKNFENVISCCYFLKKKQNIVMTLRKGK